MIIKQKYMKLFKLFLLLVIAIVIISCDTIVDLEDPLKGNITLVTDWSNRSEGIEQPANYTVIIDGQTLNFTKTSNLLPELNAGIYPIHIYNTPEKIAINVTKATVTTTDNMVDPQPGWLFTAITQVEYADFKVETATAVMQQQVRQLTFDFTVKEGDPARIASVEATLSGVANSIDFKTGNYTGNNLSVAPVFTRNGNKLTAIVRLLGLSNQTQKLTLTLTFADGKEQTIENDLSSQLAGFNTGKNKPLKLEADLNTPVEAGFEATITGWKVVDGSSGIAW